MLLGFVDSLQSMMDTISFKNKDYDPETITNRAQAL